MLYSLLQCMFQMIHKMNGKMKQFSKNNFNWFSVSDSLVCFSGLVLPPSLLLLTCTPLQSMVLSLGWESSPMAMPGRLSLPQHIPLSWVSTASECLIGKSSTTAVLPFSGKCMYAQLLSRVCISETLLTIVHQAPLSMGIFQARILERGAISFSRGSSQSKDQTHISSLAGGFFTQGARGATWEYPIIFNSVYLCLFLGRQATTNLDSALKSRDINFP